MRPTARWRFALPPTLLALAWAALDQAFKLYTLAAVPPYPERLEVVPGILSFTYIGNRGAAWGLFDGGVLPLTLLRGAAAVVLLVWLWRSQESRLQRVAFALIAGGALGNAVDGVVRGFVVDTLLSHTLSNLYRPLFGTDFPIFNLADVGVVSGVILLLLSSLGHPPRNHQPSQTNTEEAQEQRAPSRSRDPTLR